MVIFEDYIGDCDKHLHFYEDVHFVLPNYISLEEESQAVDFIIEMIDEGVEPEVVDQAANCFTKRVDFRYGDFILMYGREYEWQ